MFLGFFASRTSHLLTKAVLDAIRALDDGEVKASTDDLWKCENICYPVVECSFHHRGHQGEPITEKKNLTTKKEQQKQI